MPSDRYTKSSSVPDTAGDRQRRGLVRRGEREHPENRPEPEVLGIDYYRTRPAEFIHDCLWIIDKTGSAVPFVLNSTQRKILAIILSLRSRGMPPRLIVLKARQVGVSTLIEALIFWACMCNENRSALVIAHKLPSARVLFRMGRAFHRYLPKHLRQKKRIDNASEIEFDSGSREQVEVQGDPRGYAAQDVHLSEFAMYDQAADTLVAVMQTLPRIVESLGVIESTARGVGNKFHQVWQRAAGLAMDSETPDDERGWTPIFIPWFEHEEYRIDLNGTQLRPSADEMRLMAQHKLAPEQIKWRRWCINVNLDGDEEKFAQEYPSTAEEAFALSGRPVFDSRSVVHYTEELAKAAKANLLPQRLEIESDPPGIGEVKLIPYDRGRLRIYAEPKDRHTYIVGADPSEGDPGSDPSPLAVLDEMTLNLVAVWYGKAPPDVLACHAVDLARHYREALIINEANNHGILFHETVRQLGYPLLYYRKVSEDSVAGEVTEKPGYLSTVRNRQHLFNTLRKFVRLRMGKLPDPNFVRQLQTLVYVDEKAQAQAGAEKDLLVAFALCLMAHRGTMENPLEPFPEATVRSVAEEVALIRERDPALARKISFDRIGMTMEECLRAEEKIIARERRLRGRSIAAMR